jgi:MFS family permease
MKYLKRDEIKLLILMGIPALGQALIYTLVTTYLPYFIGQLSSAFITGLLISIEGIFALAIPILIGLWSDSISSPLGKRLPFFFAGVFISSLILICIPFSSHSLFLLALELILFFIGYFTSYEAYYALYPDLIPTEERGRSQGIMGGFRSIGMLMALTGGGVLINIWKPLPFLLSTVIFIIVAIALYFSIRKKLKISNKSKSINWLGAWSLIKKNKKIQFWLIANTLWEAAVSVLRVFIVLYFTKGLHLNLNQSSGALGMVGLSAIVAAPLAGFLADRYGHKPVMLTAIVLFAIGLLPALFTTNKYFLLGILPVAFTAVILMTLPFSLLMAYLAKEKHHGLGSALFGFCQGVGVLIGPITAGIAINIFSDVDFLVFKETKGFSAMYLIASFFLFLSVPFAIHLFRLAKQ